MTQPTIADMTPLSFTPEDILFFDSMPNPKQTLEYLYSTCSCQDEIIVKLNLYQQFLGWQAEKMTNEIVDITQCKSKKKEQCSICLKKIKRKRQLYITECSHHFHKNCIKKWFKQNINCPNCRNEKPLNSKD